MDAYKLKGKCKNDEFYALLYTCCEYGDCFSLCYSDGYLPEMIHPLETALKPYLIARQKVNQWFGYYNIPGYPAVPVLTQHIFLAIPEAVESLTKYCNDIYFTKEREDNLYKRPPFLYSDLCFFRNNNLLLGTVSHEKMAYIYPPNEEFLIDLLNAGQWVESSALFPQQLLELTDRECLGNSQVSNQN